MKHFLYIALLLPLSIQAQTRPAPGLRLHYYGYWLFHPGVQAAWEQPLWQHVREKRGKREGQIWHSLYAAPQLTCYAHRKNHYGIAPGLEAGYQATRRKGFEYQAFISGSYLLTLLANPVWEQQPDGSFARKRLAGRGSFMPGGGISLGQNLWKTGKAPLAWSVRLLFTQPYQATSVLTPNGSLGIRYYFSR